MKKEHQIIMLPSRNDFGCIGIRQKDGMLQNLGHYNVEVNFNWEAQHLYILSDEKIKEGDWYLESDFFFNSPLQATKEDLETIDDNSKYFKKIIATTDTELLTCKGVKREGESCSYNNNCKYPSCKLPQIPQHIIEAYVKKPFDKVMVEYPKDWKVTDSRYPSPVHPKLNQDGTLAVSLVESGYYAVYDEVTNKTLHIQAPTLKDAEIIAAAIDFDNFVDGQNILTNPTVTLVEEKMYSREEVVELVKKLRSVDLGY